MSEQRRFRSELKQGLHQFLMTLYNSYRQTLPHEEAVEQVSTCLVEEFEYFTKQPMKQEKSLDLATLIKDVEKLARAERDSAKQFKLYEDVEALVQAKEVLEKYNTTEGNK
ncbi:hypothetical protein ABWK22_01885 [Gottfriedia acidiceleris]|uniref:hypothetical protein n=1 Tax=Gottfriedia acidiceleris TaxID=371036 RepID=UPI003392B845